MMIGRQTGPFVMDYKSGAGRFGAMLSTCSVLWAVSGAVAGRGLVIGWVFKKERPKVPDRTWSTPE